MQVEQLFSYPLHTELWNNRLVNNEDFVIGEDHDMQQYKKFLHNQAKERGIEEFRKRKNILNKVQDLLKDGSRTPKEDEKLSSLLKRLGLCFDEDGFIILETSDPIPRKYLGVKEPYISQWERQLIEEEKRLMILRHDLKVLKTWLLSLRDAKVIKPVYSPTINWKEYERKCKQRTERRWKEMAKGRRNKIILYEAENDKKWRKICGIKQLNGRSKGMSKSVMKARVMKSIASPILHSDTLKIKTEDGVLESECADEIISQKIKEREQYPETSEKYSKEELQKKSKDIAQDEKQKSTNIRKRIRSSLVTSLSPGLRLRPDDYQKPEIKRRLKKFKNMIDVCTSARAPNNQSSSKLKEPENLRRLKGTEKDKLDPSKLSPRVQTKFKDTVVADAREEKKEDISIKEGFTPKNSKKSLDTIDETIKEFCITPKVSNHFVKDQDHLTKYNLADSKLQEVFKQHIKDSNERLQSPRKEVKSESMTPSLSSKEKYKEEVKDAIREENKTSSRDSVIKIKEKEILKINMKDEKDTENHSDKSNDIYEEVWEIIDSLTDSGLLDESGKEGETELESSKEIIDDGIEKNCSILLSDLTALIEESDKYEIKQNISSPDFNDDTASKISLDDEDVKYLIQRLVLSVLDSDADIMNNIEPLDESEDIEYKLKPTGITQLHKELAESIVQNATENVQLHKIIEDIVLEEQRAEERASEHILLHILEIETEETPSIQQDKKMDSLTCLKIEDVEIDELKSIKTLLQDIIDVISVSEFIIDRNVDPDSFTLQNDEDEDLASAMQTFQNSSERHSLNNLKELISCKEEKLNDHYKSLVHELVKSIPVSEIFIDRTEGINDMRTLIKNHIEKNLEKYNETQREIDLDMKEIYYKKMEERIDDISIEEELHRIYLEKYLHDPYFKNIEYKNNNEKLTETKTETPSIVDTNSSAEIDPEIETIASRMEHSQHSDDRIDTTGRKTIYKQAFDASVANRSDLHLQEELKNIDERNIDQSAYQRQEKLSDRNLSSKSSGVVTDFGKISTENIESDDEMPSADNEFMTNNKNKTQKRQCLLAEKSILSQRSFEKNKDEHNIILKHLFPFKSESSIKVIEQQDIKKDRKDVKDLKSEFEPGTSKSDEQEKKH